MATAAAICICALAFPATGVLAQRCINACIAEAAPTGRFLWNRISGFNGSPSGIVPVAQRRMAPDFTLPDSSGKVVRLSEFHGQVVLLNFWATWCAPCRIETPWFVELQRAYQDTGLVVLAVSLDEDGWSSVKPYMEAAKINYRVMVGGGEVAQIYGFQSLPATVMIDRAGRIAATHIGLAEKKAYEEELKALLAER